MGMDPTETGEIQFLIQSCRNQGRGRGWVYKEALGPTFLNDPLKMTVMAVLLGLVRCSSHARAWMLGARSRVQIFPLTPQRPIPSPTSWFGKIAVCHYSQTKPITNELFHPSWPTCVAGAWD